MFEVLDCKRLAVWVMVMSEEDVQRGKPRELFARAVFAVDNGVWFRDLFSTVCKAGVDPAIDMKMSGVSFRMMDRSRVYMWDVWLDRSFFSIYKCSRSGRRCFPLRDILGVALNSVRRNSAVKFSVDGKKDLLIVEVRDRISREYEFTLTDDYEETIPLPNIKFASAYTFNLKALYEDLKGLDRSGYRYVKFSGNRKTFMIEAENDDSTSCSKRAKFTYEIEGDGGLVDCKVRKKSVSKYSLDMLLELLNPKLSDLVTLRYSSNMPMKMEYHVDNKDSKINCYLAPVIVVDE